jgi:hypothetical protein
MMNVWGRSMVVPFLLSQQLPDQKISLLPKALNVFVTAPYTPT